MLTEVDGTLETPVADERYVAPDGQRVGTVEELTAGGSSPIFSTDISSAPPPPP